MRNAGKCSLWFVILGRFISICCSNRHEFENDDKWSRAEKERLKTLGVCKDINRIILNALSPAIEHLKEAEVDLEPRHEAFWFVGGINPTKLVQKIRRGKKLPEEKVMEPVDRTFQYTREYFPFQSKEIF